MLPRLDGLALLRRLRARRDATPVLILTAKDGKDAIVELLNAGADDYLAKPFDLGELIARAKALIRRGKGAAHPTLNALGWKSTHWSSPSIAAAWPSIFRPPSTASSNTCIHHPRRIFSKRELLEHLYDYNWEHHSNVIEAHVSNLRKKLEAAVARRRTGD